MTGPWIAMTACALLVPAVMALFGWIFLRRPPKSINSVYGYRTRRSMASPEAWAFAHRACGRVWLRWGMRTAVLSVLLMLPALGWDMEAAAWWTLGLTTLQCAALFLSMIPVERELKRNFDLSGHKIARDDLENKKNL